MAMVMVMILLHCTAQYQDVQLVSSGRRKFPCGEPISSTTFTLSPSHGPESVKASESMALKSKCASTAPLSSSQAHRDSGAPQLRGFTPDSSKAT